MRTIEQALTDHDLIVLRVIGEWWELDLTGQDKPACVQALAETLPRINLKQELQFLPPEEADALQALVDSGGRMAVGSFERTHGEVRLMGPGKLEREEPWFDPVSAAESLWYRGLIYRGFDEGVNELNEFYFLPDEFMTQFPEAAARGEKRETAVSPSAKPAVSAPAASPDEPATFEPVPAPASQTEAAGHAVDDLTTLLALAQQTSLHPDSLNRLDDLLLDADHDRRSLLITLAKEMGLVRQTNSGIRPTKTAVSWLQQSRGAQLRALVDAWTKSGWNDLRHTPGLLAEGDAWQNDPMLARTALLDYLPRSMEWYRVADLIRFLKTADPDFQRPDGNYDTWYIRELSSDAYITGFENWDKVEGRLIPFLLKGGLHWLGMIDLSDSGEPRFRLTARAVAWLQGQPPADDSVRVPIILQTDGTIIVSETTDRYQRFQAARISEALPVAIGEPFRYRITPAALKQAKENGISPERVSQFLQQASGQQLPTALKRGLARWQESGMEGRLEQVVILRVRDADILQTLRNNPKTRDFIGESLGDYAATVRLDAWDDLRRATAQLGLLLDVQVDGGGE